jgi:hypothetical protein
VSPRKTFSPPYAADQVPGLPKTWQARLRAPDLLWDISWPDVRLLTFDQAFRWEGSDSGAWVLLIPGGPLYPVHVYDWGRTGTRSPKPGEEQGYMASFRRGGVLFSQYMDVVAATKPELVLHELPKVKLSASRNREAPVLAGGMIHAAVAEWREQALRPCRVEGVQAQQAKLFLTGNPDAEKDEVAEAIRQLDIVKLPPEADYTGHLGRKETPANPWTKDHWDAVALPLAFIGRGRYGRIEGGQA